LEDGKMEVLLQLCGFVVFVAVGIFFLMPTIMNTLVSIAKKRKEWADARKEQVLAEKALEAAKTGPPPGPTP
tara:strand:+ start:125 stop:340 length:216 start_codon:yes stop_codon:yes gene_type:complete